jgi:hypothetical protein
VSRSSFVTAPRSSPASSVIHLAAEAAEADCIERLARRGVIRRALGTSSRRWIARRLAVKAHVVAALLRERD